MARTLVEIYPGIMKLIEKELDCVAIYGNTKTDSIKLVVFAHNLKKLGLDSEEATVAKILRDSNHPGRIMLRFGDISRGDGGKLYRFSRVAAKYRYIHVSFVTQAREMGLDESSFPQYYPVEEYNEAERAMTFRCDPDVAAALSKKYDLQAGKRAEDVSQTPPRNFQISGEVIEDIQATLGIDLTSDEKLDIILQYFCSVASQSQIVLSGLREDERVAQEG